MKESSIKISLNIAAAITGAIIIAAYIIFGGPFHSKEISRKKIRKKGVITGLANIGNSCFLNSILQALAACPSFTKWLNYRAESSSQVLVCALDRVIKILNNRNENQTANAFDVLRALKFHGWVISPEEQDAHELFHALTSTVNDEITVMRQQEKSLLNISWIPPEMHEAKDAVLEVNGWNENDVEGGVTVLGSSYPLVQVKTVEESQGNKIVIPNNLTLNNGINVNGSLFSIISKIPVSIGQKNLTLRKSLEYELPFKGHLISQLKCSLCGYRNPEQWCSFESLSLSLPNNVITSRRSSLTDLLREFVLPEYVKEVVCDGCSKVKGETFRSTFSKKLTVAKLPCCLCIHIQRTVWLESGCVVKRKDFVNIPEILNMEPFTCSVPGETKGNSSSKVETSEDSPDARSSDGKENNSGPVQSYFSTSSGNSSKMKRKPLLYKLQAVVVHVGDVFSGHFITYRKGNVDSSSSSRERWFYTSDIVVKEVSFDEVMKANAYMVLYEKHSFPI